MFKKVPKVAVLRSLCSVLGGDSVYSTEMHSGLRSIALMNSDYFLIRNVDYYYYSAQIGPINVNLEKKIIFI